MRDKTRKLQDVANLKRIADAHKTYCEKFGFVASNILGDLAGSFQTSKDRCVLNDPNVYISPGDKWASKVVKETITEYLYMQGRYQFWPFDSQYNFKAYEYYTPAEELGWSEDGRGNLFSYALITRLNFNLPQSTTPLGFTRGLKSNGLWHGKYGLYGSTGGYVVYLDGHVQWFDGSKAARFLKYDGSGWTSDIREAIPDDSYIYCGPSNITDDDGSILIIKHNPE